MRTVVAFSLLVLISSCKYFGKKNSTDEKAIARFKDEYLYASDVPGLTIGNKGKDSAEVLVKYATTWVQKKLLLQKAEENIPTDELGIDKQVADYRESLILFEYEKALIDQKLDKLVPDKEIQTYYEQYKSNFVLEQDVYRVFFIKLSIKSPDLAVAEKWITQPKSEDEQLKLQGYCSKYAGSFNLTNGIWYELQNLTKLFPVPENEIADLYADKKFHKFSKANDLFFVRIAEMKPKGELAPTDYIREQIEKILIEKRKVQLIENIYAKIYTDGAKNKSYEIYIK